MRIVIDLDNTLVDELGATLRPGCKNFLTALLQDGHELALWTSSSRNRAEEILQRFNLHSFFSIVIFREDYQSLNKNARKDLRWLDADLIIDDDPAEINFAKSTGKRGILIPPYRKDSEQNDRIMRSLNKSVKRAEPFRKLAVRKLDLLYRKPKQLKNRQSSKN